MEGSATGPNKGYQKQVKKDATPPPIQKIHPTTDYSSPAAKKWPKFVEAIQGGDVDGVKQFIEEGLNVNLLRDGVTPLMIAASAGKAEVAQALLEAGVNINEKGEDGGTALHKAAADQEDAAIVELLVQSGVDAAAKNKAGKTALQLAEEKGRRDIVLAIKHHLSQQSADAREWEEFLNSAEGKPFKAQRRYDSLTRYANWWWIPVPALAALGAGAGLLFGAPVIAGLIGAAAGALAGGVVQLREKQLRTYLDAIGPLPELDIHTLRRKRETGEPIFPPKNADQAPADEFGAALAREEASVAEANETMLIEESPVPEPTPGKASRRVSPALVIVAVFVVLAAALAGAAYYKKEALARLYYAKKLERSGIAFTGPAYIEAAGNNNLAALDLFIKAGMAPDGVNEKGQTALIVAAEKGHAGAIGMLARRDPSLLNRADKSGRTALMTAARHGHASAVQALLANGADVNYVVPANPGAATALQAALDAADFKEQHLAMVKFLLEQGADVKAGNGAGQSPLMFVADRGRLEAAALLLEKGADVNAVDLKGGFPLLLAACKGNAALAALLADKGANMKAALPDGQTPLMCAVQMGSADTVKTLLEKGADPNAKSSAGVAALHDATRMGHVEIAGLLLARGADPRGGYLPDSFKALKGKTVALAVKKGKMNAVLGKLVKPAAQDGYTLHAGGTRVPAVTLKTRAPWNKVLQELAVKSRLLIMVKERDVFLLP